jgi:hypothetical protein
VKPAEKKLAKAKLLARFRGEVKFAVGWAYAHYPKRHRSGGHWSGVLASAKAAGAEIVLGDKWEKARAPRVRGGNSGSTYLDGTEVPTSWPVWKKNWLRKASITVGGKFHVAARLYNIRWLPEILPALKKLQVPGLLWLHAEPKAIRVSTGQSDHGSRKHALFQYGNDEVLRFMVTMNRLARRAEDASHLFREDFEEVAKKLSGEVKHGYWF